MGPKEHPYYKVCGEVETLSLSLFLPQQLESVHMCLSPDGGGGFLLPQQILCHPMHSTMLWCKSSYNNFHFTKDTSPAK